MTSGKQKKLSAIAATATIINNIVVTQKSLPECLADIQHMILPNDVPKIQAYCYNVLRRYEFYQFITNRLLTKKLKNKDQDIYHLIVSGIMLLNEGNLPEHAAINETVNVTKKSKKSWSKNLVNALLRRYQREQQSLHTAANAELPSLYCCPEWLLKKIQHAYPDADKNNDKPLWQTILEANLAHPPMSLRVNQLVLSRDAYIELLRKEDITAAKCELTQHGILLNQPIAVEQLPLFSDGAVSVQDSAAQLSAELLAPKEGDNILDACAAPGGKTLHLLEYCPSLKSLTAIDVSAKRLKKVQQNIDRVAPTYQNKIKLVAADASSVGDWWDTQQFDRILLDAPCSAVGVIRRHPDIKRLRHSEGIDELIKTQQGLLQNLWPTLKSGGHLLYATCSILPEENSQQIKHFLAAHNDAQCVDFNVSWGIKREYGRQLLPTNTLNQNPETQQTNNKRNSDGFYYCLLKKL